MIFEESCD